MTGQFEDYPPEFDLSASDLQRYGITKIWAAFHNPAFRPAVFAEWRSAYRSFSAWVGQTVYAQRRAKHSPSRASAGSTRRPHWRAQYADELAASPALALALSVERPKRLGEVFSRAGLSGQETAVMRRLLEGMEPADIQKELQLSRQHFRIVRERALFKSKATLVLPPGLIQGGQIAV